MGRMIAVNGYRMFRGTMRILKQDGTREEVYGDWLYRPDTDCWYRNGGHIYDASICAIVSVD